METRPRSIRDFYEDWTKNINKKEETMPTQSEIENMILINAADQIPKQPKELTPEQIAQNEFNAGLVKVMEPYYNNIICGIACAPLQVAVSAYYQEWLKTNEAPKNPEGQTIRDLRLKFKGGRCIMVPIADKVDKVS